MLRESPEEIDARWRSQMVAAQEGNADAYQALLNELLPVVKRMVMARLRDPASTDDVVQNALLSIHRARHTYRAERPFGPWLRTIVRNASIDSLRARKRRREREVGVEDTGLLPDPAAGLDPSEGDPNALSPQLASALAALPDKQREAVTLIQVDGLSVAEAAARAGVTAGALKVRAHRGYRTLRERLKGGLS